MRAVTDLLHADRILKLMAMDIPFKEALRMDDESAAYLIEAYEIGFVCDCEGCTAEREAAARE